MNEMGLDPTLLIVILISAAAFIVSFAISSKNMDSDGIMSWMMAKPDDWVGFKDKNSNP